MCGDLRVEQAGQDVVLMGWVTRRRDHGNLIFLDVRDRTGITQVVLDIEVSDEAHAKAEAARSEYVVAVKGKVRKRGEGLDNPNMPTGQIEVVASELLLLNEAKTPPFSPAEDAIANEEVRLKYRYLDLRRPPMQYNFELRSKVAMAIRNYLVGEGFLEIETPFMTKSTPEGARDYLVPSRIHAGEFYALPQSPQIFKQILMISGFDKYFQIARCFRDEDLRADRQPEFTQIDIEASFVEADDIFTLTEGMLAAIFKAACNIDIKTPFDRVTYREAISRYGSDKPDRRFDMQLVDLSEEFRTSSFKVFRGAIDSDGVVKAINAKRFAGLTIGQSDELTEVAKTFGAKGLAFIKVENGEWKSPIVKFFSDAEKKALQSKLKIEEGDLILFAADKWEIACEVLGRIRLRIAEYQKLVSDSDQLDFLWVTDFPLLKWNAVHHPYRRQKAEDMQLLEQKKFAEMRAEAYDVVLNGVEIGGGSMRINAPQLHEKMFEPAGVTAPDRQWMFGHLLRALRLGAPPHGGIALGLDRLVMLICGAESIREVMAFPKNNRGMDLMTQSPADVDPRQLRDLAIKPAGDAHGQSGKESPPKR